MIKEIDAASAAQLKSGQVIVEFGNALKELVENSIDANATAITVKIYNYGLDGAQVTDNGDGIDPADFQLVASPHATSKLSTFDQLTQVKTLGFRGEALASLCTVANLKIQTSQGDQGYSLEFDSHGSIAQETAVAAPKGCVVTISDFFKQLPVRRKDLERNYKRKYTDAIRILQSYAIIWNGTLVIEHVYKDGKRNTVLRAQGQDISDRISLIFGIKTSSNLVKIDSEAENVRLVGRISRPMALMKGQRSSTRLIYINGRPINDNHISKLVVSIFQEFEPHGSPFFALDLKVEASQLDINITPDKRDVRLLKNFKVMREIEGILRRALQSTGETLARGDTHEALSQRGLSVGNSLTQFLGVGPIRDQNGKNSQSDSEESKGEDECEPPQKISRAEPPRPVSTGSKRPSSKSSLASFTYGTSHITGGESEQSIEDPTMGEESQDLSGPGDQSDNEAANHSSESDRSPPRDHQSPEEHSSPCNYDPSQILGSDIVLPSVQQAQPELEDLPEEDIDHNINVGAACEVADLVQEDYEDYEADTTIQDPQPTYDGSARPTSSKTLNCHISMPITIKEIEAEMELLKEPDQSEIRNFAVDEEAATHRLGLIISKTDFEEMKVIGQFNLGFILVSKDHGAKRDIFIIDQHASDEIYNFERLQKTTVMRRQPLVVPRRLDLSAVEELTLINNIHVFERNGFSIKVDTDAAPGKQCFLTAVPYSKATIFNESDINELIYKLADSQGDGSNIKCSKLRSMFAMRACRSSIMIGDPLAENSMRKVVSNLGTLDRPWNCPHGRPTLRHITTLE